MGIVPKSRKLEEIRMNRTARQLDKIEKEMGYCEIKLEKERRLRKQIDFLKADIALVERQLRIHRGARTAMDPADSARRPSREAFMAAGLLQTSEEEREILDRELVEMNARLQSYSGFETKRTVLEEEKRNTLRELSPAHSSRMRRLNESFQKVDQKWNTLSEDLINLDEGIFFLDRNLDYLRSCRTFLIAAKGSFDLEAWRAGGYLSDLFRHSSIGRAKEMAEGADRNLKLAQKELVCLSNVKIRSDAFRRVLNPFLEALYEDVFVEARLQSSLQVIEAALAGNIKLVQEVKSKREIWGARLDEIEKVRNRLFSRLDPGMN